MVPAPGTELVAGVRGGTREAMRSPEIVVVGAPLAEVKAAAMFLLGLSEAFPLPVILVVSGAVDDYGDINVTLQAHCALPVRQIDDKDPILAGRVYLAPADYHLLVERNHFVLSTEGSVNGARPSIDVLLESVADAFGDRVVCVLLGADGVGDELVDGHAGAARVRARGGLVIVRNPATAAVGEAASQRVTPPGGTMLHLSEIGPFVSRLGDVELA
jgi:two-component system chemotaxis response regulator CheB